MLEKILSFTKEYKMLETGDHIIAGVSGGADSVCLLLVLRALQEVVDFELQVIHIEHGIRGEESLEDAEFVRNLCEEQGVEYRCFHVDVPREARKKKCTIEEAARNLRYGILKREAEKWENGKIAIAHHRQDDAETVLFHMARGSGLAGLCGIHPVRGRIIRPLLHTDRSQILAYLKAQDQAYRIDSTNGDIQYSRNRIRAEIIPKLCEVNPQAAVHIQEASDRIKEALDYIESQAKEAEEIFVVQKEDGVHIQKEGFLACHKTVRGEVLRRALFCVCHSQKDMEQIHLQMLEELFLKQTGRKVMLPCGVEAYRSYDGICICKGGMVSAPEVLEFTKEELEQAGNAGIRKGFFTLRLMENSSFLEKIPQKTYTKWFDYDMIKSNLLARGRREGDYFVCDEAGHTQKLKRYFVNEKIDAKKREQICLLAEDSHILWIVGHRISAHYKVQKETKRILEVQYHGGKDDERVNSGINSGRGSK